MARSKGGASAPFSSAEPTTSRSSRQKGNRKRKQRGLDAFAIASATDPDKTKFKQHRFGEAEDDGGRGQKRRRANDDQEDSDETRPSEPQRRQQKKVKKGGLDDDDLNASEGSDSEGNEWRMGHVDEDDDEDIDSDDAFGESDEEKFDGFSFRGSSQVNRPAKKNNSTGKSKAMDLDEGEDSDAEEDDDDESLGDDAVDLATMLDDEYASESVDSDDANIKTDRSSSKKARKAHSSDEESDEDDESDAFGFSDEDEDEEDDQSKLEQLQGIVSALPSNIDDDDDNDTPLDTQANRNRLLAALKGMGNLDPAFSRSAKKLTQSNEATQAGQNDKLVKVPLPKRQQDRIDRTVAYTKAKETLSRWIDTVKQNRRADHLSFPLIDPDAQAAAGTTQLLQTGDGVPRNELENAIQTILQESGLAVKGGRDAEEQVRQVEELKSKSMPMQEVMARQAELRKRRDLLFREERRAKRISKIKSKAYRRIHRREKERMADNERQTLTAAGLVDSEEEKERNDRRRAEERMGARHRESKWAKGMKESGRTTWDEDARSGITDMARRNEELRRRMEGRKARNSDDDSVDLSDDEDDEDEDGGFLLRDALQTEEEGAPEKESKLSSMAFMKRAEAARKKQNDDAIEAMRRDLGEEVDEDGQDEPDTNLGRRIFGPNTSTPGKTQTPAEQRGELEEAQESDNDDDEDDQLLVRGASPGLSTESQLTAKVQHQQEQQPKGSLKRTSSKRLRIAGTDNVVYEDPEMEDDVDPLRPLDIALESQTSKKTQKASKSEKQNKSTVGESAGSDDEVDDTLTPSNLDLVRAAFGGDDVEESFAKEKKVAAEEEDDQYEDTTMPGWGSWAGQDTKPRRPNPKRIVKKKTGVKAADRKDANLDRVILSEKRIKKNSKYLAPQLPHPFESKQQYERSLRVPVGPEWTTKETFQKSTKPRVLVKQGIIRPMHKPLV